MAASTVPARVAMLTKLLDLCRKARNGEYYVKRGAVNWTTFPFDKRPRAISVQVDDFSILRQTGMNEGKLSLEMASRMAEETTDPQIDDTEIDRLISDAEGILYGLMKAVDKAGDSVLLRLDRESVNVVEFHDTSRMVQGIVVSFFVVY